MSHDILQHTRVVQRLLDAGISFATVTLLSIRGSAPQVVGAKAIVTADGIESGTVGGGKIEATAIKHAQQLLQDPQAAAIDTVTWNLQTDIGMTCGGEVQLLFELHGQSVWPIAVFGAGHVAQTLIPMLTQLNCHVNCVDSRSSWLDKLPPHPRLRKLCLPVPSVAVAQQPPDAFFVLISKGHSTDLPVLIELLQTRTPPYVGVIGSQQKARVLRREVLASGVEATKFDAVHCPIGEPIGNNTPIEISISILAQLIRVRDQTSANR